jgi:hypothetical protein
MQQVRKRRVFYVSGFDPRGAAAYHRLFREESQKHAAQRGVSIRVGRRDRETPLRTTWQVERAEESGTVSTTIEFMHWDDIARRHWHEGLASLYALAFKTYWHWLVSSDSLLRVYRIARWNFVTGIAPAAVLFVLPLVGLLAAWGGYTLGQRPFPQSVWPGAMLGVAGFAAVAGAGWWLERFFSLAWLLRTCGFVLDYSLGVVPELDDRIARFSTRLADYLAASDDDEILVVGHSVGANVAVSLLARTLSGNPLLLRQAPPVAFLTLGGSIPMQGLLPWAQPFRDELAQLAANQDFSWVDISATQDVASFALLNPVVASGVTPPADCPERPLVVSGAFRERLTPETYETASWDVFRMHFQYLMAGELAFENDYLSMTTDGRTFRERFGTEMKPALNADGACGGSDGKSDEET